MRDERPENLRSKDVDQKDVKPCAACGGQLTGKDGRGINVYRVTIDSLILDPTAVRGFVGLTMMLGGHAGLAAAFNPDPKLLKCFGSHQLIICFDCYCKGSAAALDESAMARDAQDAVTAASETAGKG